MKTRRILSNTKHSKTKIAPRAQMVLPAMTPPGIVPEVTCERCQTAEYLVYEQVRPVVVTGSAPEAWDVECWCGKCEQFYGMRTTQEPITPFSGPHIGPSLGV